MPVTEHCSANNVECEFAESLTGGNTIGLMELPHRHEAPLCQNRMVRGQLNPALAQSGSLRGAVRQPEDTSVPKRRFMPAGDATGHDLPGRINRHHAPGVSVPNKPPDPLPRSVFELNKGVVPKALQDIRDI